MINRRFSGLYPPDFLPSASYVYAIEVAGVVRYVAIGTGLRAWDVCRYESAQRRPIVVLLRAALADAGERIYWIVIVRDALEYRDAVAFRRELLKTLDGELLWNYRKPTAPRPREYAAAEILTPRVRALISARTREAMASPEVRARISERTREAMARPEVRAKMREVMARPEVRAKMREVMASQEYREAQSARTRALWADPAYRANHVAKTREAMASPEYREAQSARTRALWADPAYRSNQVAKARALLKNPDYLSNISKKVRALWTDPAYRANQVAKARANAEKKAREARTARARRPGRNPTEISKAAAMGYRVLRLLEQSKRT